jgi:hypothetical protein
VTIAGLEFDLVESAAPVPLEVTDDVSRDVLHDLADDVTDDVLVDIPWEPTDQHAQVVEVHVGDDIFGNATFDLVEDPSVAAQHVEPVASAVSSNDVLGFVVEYGTPQEPYVPDLPEVARLEVDSTTPDTTPVSAPAAPPTMTSMLDSMRTTPRGSPIVLPTPAGAQRAVDSRDKADDAEARDSRAPRLTVQNTDDIQRARRPRRPIFRWS